MAGLGRRTHYRKHLTDAVLYDLPEPQEDERIARVVSTRGSNQFDIVVPTDMETIQLAILPTKFHKLVWLKRNDHVIVQTVVGENIPEEDGSDSNGEEANEKIKETASKEEDTTDDQKGSDEKDITDLQRPSAVATASDSKKKSFKKEENVDPGIKYIITHILYKDQIKHLQSKGIWPEEFATVSDKRDEAAEAYMDDDGIVYDQGYEDDEHETGNDDDLFVNTNRIAKLVIQDSSSEEESDED